MPGISEIVRFGVFEVDLAKAELRKQGVRLRLQEQPFQVLGALLERPGEIVSREELIRRLWPDGTVVDFDRGLNAAVTRLRQALSDSAETPRYVETVARRGYRFIGPVERAPEPSANEPAPRPPDSVAIRRRPVLWLSAIPIVILGGALVWWLFNRTERHEFGASLRATPLTAATGVERNPSFSPEGTQVVYQWERENGSQHLYVKGVGPGDPIPLTSGEGAEYGPAWSPDGKWIAYIGRQQKSWGVYMIAPVGGTARKVADIAGIAMITTQRPYRHLDWTRDSRHVIASVLGQPMWESLLLVSVETGQTTWLTSARKDVMSGDREPAVSPDGRTVAFARGAVDSEHLYMLPLTADLRPAGQPRPIDVARQARGPAWMANGRELILTTLDSGVIAGLSLSWMDLSSGKPPRPLVALGAAAATPAVSRRGTIAYSTIGGESTFWRQDIPVDGKPAPPPVKVTSAATFQMGAEYSPDGSRIAFASTRSGTREIWNCASDGSHCLQVTSMSGHTFTGSPRWSPDGKQIVFQSMSGAVWDVYAVDANGGGPRQITGDGRHGGFPYWSHDGKWIYYSSVDSGKHLIWKIPATGGKASQVTRDRGHILVDSYDSKVLFYSDGAKLFRSSADGSGEKQLLNDLAYWSFAVARDRIYYLHEDREGLNEIRQFLISTGETSSVARIDKPLTNGLSLSPDGRSLLYAEMRSRGNLMISEDGR